MVNHLICRCFVRFLKLGFLPSTGITRFRQYYEPLRHPLAAERPYVRWPSRIRPPQAGFPCFPLFLVGMLSPTTPAKRVRPSSKNVQTRTSLPPVQAGSAFASCISGPTRRSRMLRPTNLQTALRRLLSPKLRLLRYLHIRWDSYPAGTTFTGAGLPPAGITELSRHTWTSTPKKGPFREAFIGFKQLARRRSARSEVPGPM